jgi:cobaltochelatase CobS
MLNNELNQAQDFASSIRRKVTATGALDELKVDPFFEEDPAAAKIVEFALKRRKNLFIVGPTGCGKSSLVINIMARLKERAEIFNCNGETSIDELIAKQWLENGATVVKHGSALRCYKEGKILLMEEVDFAASDMLAAMHRIMELNQQFYVCNIGPQEVITKHGSFAVIATANTIGCGEDTFMYSGTKPLNQAFMNRFSLTVKMGYLSPDKEIKVLKAKTGINEKVAELLVNTANDVRDASDPTRVSGSPGSQSIAAVISTRDLLEWADAIVGMNMTPKEAAQYAFLNRINDTDRDTIETFISNRCA